MIRELIDSDFPSVKTIYDVAFPDEHTLEDLEESWRDRSKENSYGIFTAGYEIEDPLDLRFCTRGSTVNVRGGNPDTFLSEARKGLPPEHSSGGSSVGGVLTSVLDGTQDTLAGFVVCSFHKKSGPNLYIDYIAVDVASRGQGLGTQLLHHMIDKCSRERRGLHLFPDSFELAAWYKTFGFYETPDTKPVPGKPPYYLNWSPYSRRS